MSTFYDPRVKVLEKKARGKFQLEYFLPNGVRRRVSLPCKTKMQARKMALEKENELKAGVFDAKDAEKMPESKFSEKEHEALGFDEGIAFYLEKTSGGRRPDVQENETYQFHKIFNCFKTEFNKNTFEEIECGDVEDLILYYRGLKLSESTLDGYFRSIRKIYRFLIRRKKISCENPVIDAEIKFVKTKMVRKRMLAEDEAARLFTALDSLPPFKAQFVNIIKLLMFTGARLGEVLHAEHADFDLVNGIWHIRYKPNCPKRKEIGWMPKWGKERSIYLFPEALEVVRGIPRQQNFGKVIIEGNVSYLPANFLFSKTEFARIKRRRKRLQTRLDSVKKSWESLLSEADIVNLQVKDLRTHFNSILKSKYHFTDLEASAYLGNSPEVNRTHYTVVDPLIVRGKSREISLINALGNKTEINNEDVNLNPFCFKKAS